MLGELQQVATCFCICEELATERGCISNTLLTSWVACQRFTTVFVSAVVTISPSSSTHVKKIPLLSGT
jgi:hypothetical protein